jgi:hypothetical protein
MILYTIINLVILKLKNVLFLKDAAFLVIATELDVFFIGWVLDKWDKFCQMEKANNV